MDQESANEATAPHDCAQTERLLRLLQNDDVDAAIEAGLMHFVPCPACDPAQAALLTEARQRLSKAWTARDRYLARNARLARRAAERDAKRAITAPEKKSALPPAAAAILARAKAKAAERSKP